MGFPDSLSAAPVQQLKEAERALVCPETPGLWLGTSPSLVPWYLGSRGRGGITPPGLQTTHSYTSSSEWGPLHCPDRVPWLAPGGPPVHRQQMEANRCGFYCPHLLRAQQTPLPVGKKPSSSLPQALGIPSLERPSGFYAQRRYPCSSVACSKPGGGWGACLGPQKHIPLDPQTH